MKNNRLEAIWFSDLIYSNDNIIIKSDLPQLLSVDTFVKREHFT